MGRKTSTLKYAVAALVAGFVISGSALAVEDSELDALFEGLRGGDPAAAAQIEQRIYDIWSKSGSPSMDLLLERGRKALEGGDWKTAVEHFSALIDHAPDFAEGYNGRATAYFMAGQFGQAVEDIGQTLSLNPKHFAAMSGLALILQELGRPEDALEIWREVETLTPHREGLSQTILELERQVDGQTL